MPKTKFLFLAVVLGLFFLPATDSMAAEDVSAEPQPYFMTEEEMQKTFDAWVKTHLPDNNSASGPQKMTDEQASQLAIKLLRDQNEKMPGLMEQLSSLPIDERNRLNDFLGKLISQLREKKDECERAIDCHEELKAELNKLIDNYEEILKQ